MRVPLVLTSLIVACHPSATVQNTMPVANLQTYHSVALRVQSTAFASQGQAMLLEQSVLERVHQVCGFEQVGRVGATKADVILDLNVTATGRGGGGIISNSSQATIDTLLVLSDGESGELLGTARIHGQSSGMIINNGSPENEAIQVVANTIANLLSKSGCSGPRIAKAEPPPPPPPGPGSGAGSGSASTGQGSASAPDESHRADAEALNEQGKEKLRSADLTGALAAFQQANKLLPDARYQYNVCLTLEAQEQWDGAIAACKEARGMNPEARLVSKIDHRLDLLAHHQ